MPFEHASRSKNDEQHIQSLYNMHVENLLHFTIICCAVALYIGGEKKFSVPIGQVSNLLSHLVPARAAARPRADSRAISSSDFRSTFFRCRTSRSVQCSSFAISRNSFSSFRTS